MKPYLAKKIIGIDSETGLNIELRATDVLIEPKKPLITVTVEECLVSPTGIVMKILTTRYYTRNDKEGNEKFSNLQNSQIGVAIENMLLLDLDKYPNLDQ